MKTKTSALRKWIGRLAPQRGGVLAAPVAVVSVAVSAVALIQIVACGSPPVAPGSSPDRAPPIVLEGRFDGAETGDYNHLHMARAMGPDCEFWGYGLSIDEAAIERLETDASLLGEPLRVAFTIDTVTVPEAGGSLTLALPDVLWFPAVDGLRAPATEPGLDAELTDELEAARRAAHAYVTEVAMVDLPLRIVDVGHRGDDAVAVALYDDHPDPTWQRSFVVLRREQGSWSGIDYGSGLEPPGWYLCAASDDTARHDTLDTWLGTWVWQEPGFRHGGDDGDAVYSGWTWTLELEPNADGGAPVGRLTIDGFQTAEEYAVRVEGDGEEVRLVARDSARDTADGDDVLLTLYRAGYQVLTRFSALSPRGAGAVGDGDDDGPADRWTIRFRR